LIALIVIRLLYSGFGSDMRRNNLEQFVLT
jgi:hypothetical protein